MPTDRKPCTSDSSSETKQRALFSLLFLVLTGLSAWGQQDSSNGAIRRISPDAKLGARATLAGHRTAWATPGNDIGPVSPSTPIHLQLLLTRDAGREAAFQQRLADQQDRTSPLFHQWLTPAQIGAMYGPAPADITAIRAWLASQGLTVEPVAPSGIFIAFSGPAAAVEQAFQTSLHLYQIPVMSPAIKQAWRAPTTEPTVPAAFLQVVSAIDGLAEMPLQAPHHAVANTVSDPSVQPLVTTTTGGHEIAPADFATI